MKKLTTTENTEELAEFVPDENDLKWEQCHAKICNAILQHVSQYGTMPGKTVIADATGLSRVTVYKHLHTFAGSPTYQAELESLHIMTQPLMGSILRAAMHGDMQAAKLFLDTVKTNNNAGAEKKTSKQNNYVQINKTVINQQIIQQLKPEQLNRIEELIAKELHEK